MTHGIALQPSLRFIRAAATARLSLSWRMKRRPAACGSEALQVEGQIRESKKAVKQDRTLCKKRLGVTG